MLPYLPTTTIGIVREASEEESKATKTGSLVTKFAGEEDKEKWYRTLQDGTKLVRESLDLIDYLNIPRFPTEHTATIEGSVSSWWPGIKTDIADNLILPGANQNVIQKYCDAHYGNSGLGEVWASQAVAKKDIGRRIIWHWLKEDKVLEPFWSDFAKRGKMIVNNGIKTSIGVEFSTWGDWPRIQRLHNVYRSAVVNRDLGRLGIEIIPVLVVAPPEDIPIHNGYWPDKINGPILVDANHLHGSSFNWNCFEALARYAKSRWPNNEYWIWSYSPDAQQAWTLEYKQRNELRNVKWIKTESWMSNKVREHKVKQRNSK